MKKKQLNLFDAGIAFILSFALAQVTTLIGVTITQSIMEACGMTTSQITNFWNGAFGYLLQALYMNIGFVLVFVWYYKKREYPKSCILKSPDNSTWKYVGICILFGIGSLFLLSGALNYFQLLLDKLGFSAGTLSYELDSFPKYLITLFSMAVLPAVCEELLFRGVIAKALSHKSQIFAIFVSSLMFAIFHFSPSQLIYPMCFGLILGTVYLRTKNILFPILLHFINNALSISIQYFSTSSSTEVFTHSASMLIYSILTLAIWIFAICYLIKEFKDFTAGQQNAQTANTQSNNIDLRNEVDSKSVDRLNANTLYICIGIMLVLYIVLVIV